MADMFDSGCISHIVLPVTRSYAVRKFGEEFSRSYKRYFLETKYANVYVNLNNNWSIGFKYKVLGPPTKREEKRVRIAIVFTGIGRRCIADREQQITIVLFDKLHCATCQNSENKI